MTAMMSAFSKIDLYNESVLSYEIIEKHRVLVNTKSGSRVSCNSGSSGNQRKWHLDDGRYVKLNCLGYEDIAEVCADWLFKSITNLPYDFVKYYPCEILEDGVVLGHGVFSYDFINGKEEITFAEILQENLQSFAISYDDIADLVDTAYGVNIRGYLDVEACLDAMTRNEDSHWGNFSLLIGDDVKPMIFDYGDAFMSDCVNYPIDCDFEKAYSSLKAKPFRLNFEEQINPFCKRLYLSYNKFVSSIDTHSSNQEFARAITVLLRSLQKSKNVAWEDIG